MKKSEIMEEAIVAIVNSAANYDSDDLIEILDELFERRRLAKWSEDKNDAAAS